MRGIKRADQGEADKIGTAMSREAELLKQAARAERLADQAVDKEVVGALRDAAKEYRGEAAQAHDSAEDPSSDS